MFYNIYYCCTQKQKQQLHEKPFKKSKKYFLDKYDKSTYIINKKLKNKENKENIIYKYHIGNTIYDPSLIHFFMEGELNDLKNTDELKKLQEDMFLEMGIILKFAQKLK